MKRVNVQLLFSASRQRSTRVLIVMGLLYLLLVGFEVPFVYRNGLSLVSQADFSSGGNGGFLNSKHFVLEREENLEEKEAPSRPVDIPYHSRPERRIKELAKTPLSSLNFSAGILNSSFKDGILKSAKEAFELGGKLWQELESMAKNRSDEEYIEGASLDRSSSSKFEECPHSILIPGNDFLKKGRVVMLPCGLTLGSHITVVAKPRVAHWETDPKISLLNEGQHVMVSQFMMELQGLRAVEREDPPRILHFNPRLKGDWRGKPVIEQNTCYRMQWGTSQRCEGWRSRADEETVDGLMKCEKWIRDDDNGSEESKTMWWLNRLIGRTKKVAVVWPFPFVENKLFVLTLIAGLEGYHISVDGRHISSFPYRTGFTLEDATGLFLNGDIDVHYVFAASLPTSHPSFAPQKHLDLSERWKAPPIRDGPVELFIGVLSSGNHFAERMAVRKTWMQHKLIKSSMVVARFFVALHARKEVNVEVNKEANFFGDIVIVQYMDNYDLVVLKTVAICEYGVRALSANYIMKGDDDTFVRVDAIIKEAKKVPNTRSLYIGNINYYHKPLRSGKWAVTYEVMCSVAENRALAKFDVFVKKLKDVALIKKKEWPEEEYPPYANGPGYIISSDIANLILSDFEKHKLRLFKMEDVSMGMWVEKVNTSRPVEYIHSLKFCQFGCVEDYYTAHYQSPRQMICLWNKMRQQGRPLCCDMR